MTQVPLQEDQFLILRGPNSFDPQALIRAVEPLGFSAFVGSRSQMAQSEIERMLVDKGISYLWQLVQLQEAVLPPAPAGERAPLLRVLGVMIQRLAPTRGFTIVDRYLLPGSGPDPEYLAELMSLLEPVASRVDQLRLVTGERNPTLWRELTSALAASCPSCLVTHAQSSRYHDRFWIADDARGLLVGTSLNGLGRRYAVVDYLANEDVNAIVQDLRDEGLLA